MRGALFRATRRELREAPTRRQANPQSSPGSPAQHVIRQTCMCICMCHSMCHYVSSYGIVATSKYVYIISYFNNGRLPSESAPGSAPRTSRRRRSLCRSGGGGGPADTSLARRMAGGGAACTECPRACPRWTGSAPRRRCAVRSVRGVRAGLRVLRAPPISRGSNNDLLEHSACSCHRA